MDYVDDVETIDRFERFDVLLPEIKPDIGKLQIVKLILKTATSDCVGIESVGKMLLDASCGEWHLV